MLIVGYRNRVIELNIDKFSGKEKTSDASNAEFDTANEMGKLGKFPSSIRQK